MGFHLKTHQDNDCLEAFSALKCTRYCLAAGLCPNPLGELKRSPRPSSRKRGLYFFVKSTSGADGRHWCLNAEQLATVMFRVNVLSVLT